MAIKGTSDSLSRCDPQLYTNIYEVRPHPAIKKPFLDEVSFSKVDTLEISREKLKEEALSRLRHTTKYTIPQNSFMRIGKYLFLALTFPPYLVLYGLPKWIITEGFPAIFSLLSVFVKISYHKINEKIKIVVNRVAELTQLLQKLSYHVLIQPVLKVISEINQRLKRFKNQAKEYLNQINFNLFSPAIFLKIVNYSKSLKKSVLSLNTHISKKIKDNFKILQNYLNPSYFNSQKIIDLGIKFFHYLSAQNFSFSLNRVFNFQLSKQAAYQTTQWFFEQYQQMQLKIKNQINSLSLLISKMFYPKWMKIKHSGVEKWRKGKQFFNHKHQRALNWFKDKQKKRQALSFQQWKDCIAANYLIKHLPLSFQKGMRHLFIYQAYARFFNAYAKLINFIFKIGYQVLNIKEKFLVAKFKISDLFRLINIYFAQKIRIIFKISQSIIQSVIFYSLYYSLLSTVMGAAFCLWSLNSLNDLTNNLIHIFSKNRLFSIKN